MTCAGTPGRDAARKAAPVVLVVDDDADLRRLVLRQMEFAGYEAIECANGADALRVASTRPVDLALVDVEMPGASGYDVVTSFRADPVLAAIPVLLMSSRSLSRDVVKGFRLGAQDYLRKPFELSELQARVDATIEIRRLRVELEAKNEELQLISRTDALTGIWNRRHLQEQLDISCAASRRRCEPLAVLMVDIDHFKYVNDAYGHDGGDLVLSAVAERLRAGARVEDIVGRWGGEEFLLVLPRTASQGAATVADRIVSAMRATPVDVGNGLSVTVTASIGVATGVGAAPQLLVSEADTALFTAKRDGRDRVVASPRSASELLAVAEGAQGAKALHRG